MSYTEIVKPENLGYLLKEDRGFLLLENGMKIIIADDQMTEISKPSAPAYSEITKPT